jgi:DNA primase
MSRRPLVQAAPIGYGFLFSIPGGARDRIAPSDPDTLDSALEVVAMPGIRYAEVRARVTMAEVLGLLGFVPCATCGDQVRGPCPVHHSATPSSRSFSANRRLHIYRCFQCGPSGNQLDLYAAATGLCLFEATVRLCEQLHREVPWIEEERSPQSRRTDRFTP